MSNPSSSTSLNKPHAADYTVIYDGRCNLCVSLVQILEQLDRGQQFVYLPMQDEKALSYWQITPSDCQAGMIVIDNAEPNRRWQGAAAAEQLATVFPLAAPLLAIYRQVPGVKPLGEQVYAQVRDNRYAWFGGREGLYESVYAPVDQVMPELQTTLEQTTMDAAVMDAAANCTTCQNVTS
jgi:predicted DCC family thiol-disulfide oxidoreductase YuxK